MKRFLQILFSCIVAAVLVWFVFRGTDPHELRESIRGVNWRWLVASQIPVWMSFVTRIWRWGYIVRPTAPASFRGMFSATHIAFLVNFTLPMRLGEFVRAIVLTRLEKIPISKSIALTGLDRVTDIIGLMAVMGVALLAFPSDSIVTIPAGTLAGLNQDYTLPQGLIKSGSIGVGIALLVLVVTLVMLYLNQQTVYAIHDWCVGLAARIVGVASQALSKIVTKLGEKTRHMLHEFSEGLHVFRSPGDMVKSISLSLITWGLFTLTTEMILLAFHVQAPWYSVFVIQGLVALSTSISVTPGFVGQFHLAVIIGVLITSPSTSIPTAKALAITAHALNLLPVVIAGVVCLILERSRLAHIPLLAEAPTLETTQEG